MIPTKDRPAQIAQTLMSLSAQSLPGELFEVIVVDTSNEQNHKLLLTHMKQFPGFRLLYEPKPGPAAARNRGIADSRSDTILFLDDDVIPDPPLLEEHLQTHQEHAAVAVLGPVRFRWDGTESAFYWALADCPGLLQSFRFSNPTNVPFVHFYTANISVRRVCFEHVGLFDEDFHSPAFEDTEFGYRFVRSGYQIVFNPRASALHDFGRSFYEFARDRYRAGRWQHLLFTKHPQLKAVILPGDITGPPSVSPLKKRLLTAVAPTFERHLPSTFLPYFGRLCQLYLDHQFWEGFMDAERSSLSATGNTDSLSVEAGTVEATSEDPKSPQEHLPNEGQSMSTASLKARLGLTEEENARLRTQIDCFLQETSLLQHQKTELEHQKADLENRLRRYQTLPFMKTARWLRRKLLRLPETPG